MYLSKQYFQKRKIFYNDSSSDSCSDSIYDDENSEDSCSDSRYGDERPLPGGPVSKNKRQAKDSYCPKSHKDIKQTLKTMPIDFSEPPDKVRSVGEQVRYWSSTHKRWIETTIKARNLDGTYKLGCKRNARGQFIRAQFKLLPRVGEFWTSKQSWRTRMCRSLFRRTLRLK